ncbi:MAG: SRPBCC domain-containing protein [Bdellovibrionota bacterium]
MNNERFKSDDGGIVTTFKTSRKILATVEEVFGAFHPERLARWWGPAGFTNTFNTCELKNGGRWSFVMHGPDGKNYQNESVFAEVEAPTKIVIQHISEPKFRLTITLEPSTEGTTVFWAQAFENSEVARRVEHIVVPSNEENLERLSAEVLKGSNG